MGTKTSTRGQTEAKEIEPDVQLEPAEQRAETALKPTTATTTTTAGQTAAEPNRRLVVELNRNTAGDLAWLVDTEEMNKTNLVNRAVQVYRMVIEAQQNGGGMTIDDPARGAPERVRVV